MTAVPAPLPQISDQAVADVPHWQYRTVNGSGVCRLRVWLSAGLDEYTGGVLETRGHVAVVTEIPDNPGMSVTNSAEHILPALHLAFPGPLVVLEHYRGVAEAAGWLRKERLDRVWLADRRACWQPVWPVSPAHPAYEAHALWAALYFQQITGCAPDIPVHHDNQEDTNDHP